jgi:hypothetical protein
MSILPCLNSISLIRYLLMWRVNGSLVWLPRFLSVELSQVLGAIITKRLPTNEAQDWRKALASTDEGTTGRKGDTTSPRAYLPGAPWPIEAVLFVYPGKRTYGKGELILWELKLIGESADHGFFLEVILPAMEEAGYTSDPQWNRPNKLWGRFDIHSVYVARGPSWEPLVSDGRLDLRYRASPIQWTEGLTFGSGLERKFTSPTRLTWLTPFDLRGNRQRGTKKRGTRHAASVQVPTLRHILEALLSRINSLIPGLHNAPDDAWDILCTEEQPLSPDIIEQAGHVPILHKNLKRAPKGGPGRWIGTQIFSHVPSSIIPYLELASILHIGRQTHFGCGTFSLIRSTGDRFK